MPENEKNVEKTGLRRVQRELDRTFASLGHGMYVIDNERRTLLRNRASESQARGRPEMGERQTIIIAEDQAQIANLIKFKLEKSGYQVLWGKNGQLAWELIQNNPCDLVILDVMMPIMDGFEVLNAMKAEPSTKEIPVIMLTAKGMEEDIIKGFDAGVVDYLVKPFSVTELAARVKATIDRSP